MAFSVEDAVDRLVNALEEPREWDGAWHPSAIFGCPRKAIYEYHQAKQSDPPDQRAKRVFRMGNVIHEFVQKAIMAHPEVLAVFIEVKVHDPVRNIKGSADAVALLQDGSWRVIEIKSMNSMAFRYLNGTAKPEHRGQAGTYLLILRDYGAKAANVVLGARPVTDPMPVDIPPLDAEDARFVRFAYVSKDDFKVEEFDVVLDDNLIEEIDDRITLLNTHRDAGTLPRRLPDVKSTRKADNGKAVRDPACTYCVFQTDCWSGPDEGVAP